MLSDDVDDAKLRLPARRDRVRRILIKPVHSTTEDNQHELGGRWYRQIEETGECLLGCFGSADAAIRYTRGQGDEPVVDAFDVDPDSLKNVPERSPP